MQAVVVKGGSTQQAGLQFLSLPQGRDKGPIQIRTLSLPCGRDKTGAPSVVLTPPPVQQPPSLRISIMGQLLCRPWLAFPKTRRHPMRSQEAFPIASY